MEKTYPFIDKNREAALGASYGGYMANWLLVITPIVSSASCRTTGRSRPNSLWNDGRTLVPGMGIQRPAVETARAVSEIFATFLRRANSQDADASDPWAE